MPKVAIIILNWNGWKDTIECLESLQRLSYPNYQIIVVDNGSTNDSIKKIKDWCEGKISFRTNMVESSLENKPVEYIEYDKVTVESGGEIIIERSIEEFPPNKKLIIIHSEKNYGFPGGNNIAIKYALKKEYDLVWLVNNDASVDKNALTEMVKIAEHDRKIGIIGSTIRNYDESEITDRNKSAKQDKSSLKKIFIPVDWIEGSSLLIRKEVIEKVGLLDENYFLFGEDKDWCTRARRSGWELVRALKSIVWHKWGASTESKRIEKIFFGKKVLRIPWESYFIPGYYESRNGIYYMKKNYPLYFLPYLIIRTLHLIVQILAYDDRKIQRTGIILKGAWHGLIGKMGKTIQPVRVEK